MLSVTSSLPDRLQLWLVSLTPPELFREKSTLAPKLAKADLCKCGRVTYTQ